MDIWHMTFLLRYENSCFVCCHFSFVCLPSTIAHLLKMFFQRQPPCVHHFTDNAVVIVNPNGEMNGSGVTGPVAKESADMWPRIAANAGTVVWGQWGITGRVVDFLTLLNYILWPMFVRVPDQGCVHFGQQLGCTHLSYCVSGLAAAGCVNQNM